MQICDGCGTSRTFEDIKKERPSAISCCPERKMRDLLPAEYEEMRGLVAVCREMNHSLKKNSGFSLNTPWYEDWVYKVISRIPQQPL